MYRSSRLLRTQLFQHGNFIAVWKLHALDAFCPYFLRECGLLYNLESIFVEKIGLIGQSEDASDSKVLGFGQGSCNKFRAYPPSLMLLGNG
jgi:hypothetical protein